MTTTHEADTRGLRRPMRNRLATAVVVLIVGVLAPRSSGLTRDQVLVVANAASKPSMALAEYYLQARGIPRGQLVTVRTTRSDHISRADYERQIVAPLRQEITRRKLRNRIRCLCLIWGIPVRVDGRWDDDAPGRIRWVYLTFSREARRRLGVAYDLLDSVGTRFVDPRTETLEPVEALFADPPPKPPRRPPSVADITLNIDRRLAERQRRVGAIADPRRRRIASRQLMAIRLYVYGLDGLVRHIRAAHPPGAPDAADLARRLTEARNKLAIEPAAPSAAATQARLDLRRAAYGLAKAGPYAAGKARAMPQPTDTAAVDSELALLWAPPYTPDRFRVNPLYWRVRQRARRMGRKLPPVLMAARIDGPTADDAREIIRASIATEKTGLHGVFYIDAGASKAMMKKNVISRYDLHLVRLYSFLRANTDLKVVLDRKPEVFPPKSCPNAAMYVGWYSLKRYVPAFTWRRGAVGWHIASFEAMSLRNPKSPQWCVKMIQNGVAATLGPVHEPYLAAFPKADEFFPLLLTGKWTLAECYWRTTPMTSWRMTLIGDPLYNPFAAHPKLKPNVLPSGLAPPVVTVEKTNETGNLSSQ